MPFAFRLRTVLKRGAVVQQGVAVHQLNSARLKFHVQIDLGIIGDVVKQVEGFDLRPKW